MITFTFDIVCATLCACIHESHRTHVVYEGSTLGVVQGTTNMSRMTPGIDIRGHAGRFRRAGNRGAGYT